MDVALAGTGPSNGICERKGGTQRIADLDAIVVRLERGSKMQEKRFLLVVFLTRRDGYHSSQDLASGIQDNHSNVICNLNMLASAGIVIADREPATGIVRLAINRGLLQNLEEFFATGALKESG